MAREPRYSPPPPSATINAQRLEPGEQQFNYVLNYWTSVRDMVGKGVKAVLYVIIVGQIMFHLDLTLLSRIELNMC